MNPSNCFSTDYREARAKFLKAASFKKLLTRAYPHPLPGRDGEDLAMDTALFGPEDSDRLLLITSATHGVEGFCGSGVQLALINDDDFHARAEAAGVAVLYVHGVNPWGFSWLRRWTHENVDLNRNCIDFSDPAGLPENPAYDEVADLLVPDRWPDPEADDRLAAWVGENGFEALKNAVQHGQYRHPDGLFFGGVEPTWSNRTFRRVLRDFCGNCSHLAFIDIHTGLGPEGHGEKILLTGDSADKILRARRWWGEVTSLVEGDSVSSLVAGPLACLLPLECPQAEITDIAIEYGTLPPDVVLSALRADQWLYRTPNAEPGVQTKIRKGVLSAFFIDTDHWKTRVLDQGITAATQALTGLSSV